MELPETIKPLTKRKFAKFLKHSSGDRRIVAWVRVYPRLPIALCLKTATTAHDRMVVHKHQNQLTYEILSAISALGGPISSNAAIQTHRYQRRRFDTKLTARLVSLSSKFVK